MHELNTQAAAKAQGSAAPINGRRPIPGDWLAICMTMTNKKLAKHYRASSEVIQRWMRESGVNKKLRTSQRMWTKDEVAKLTEMSSNGMSVTDIAAVLKRSRQSVDSKRETLQLTRDRGRMAADISGEVGDAEARRCTMRLERAILKSAKKHGVFFVDTSRRGDVASY